MVASQQIIVVEIMQMGHRTPDAGSERSGIAGGIR
jgi:hypothetical protein